MLSRIYKVTAMNKRHAVIQVINDRLKLKMKPLTANIVLQSFIIQLI